MKKLGFGFLRLPTMESEENKGIDLPLLNEMVDEFLRQGGTYFDTAYTYLGGKSEWALKQCLTLRHPRESYILADKLPSWQVKSPEENRKYFDEQLERCGVRCFDVYLLHWLNEKNYAIAEAMNEFEFLQQLKASGEAKRIGFSYHDTAELLDRILTKHPEVDVVQLQINYLDWESEAIQSRKCYEVAVKHGKTVLVMEPVKGGTLAQLPEKAAALVAEHSEESPASLALRFAASLPQVEIVLSGMNSMEQMKENLQDKAELTTEEYSLLEKVSEAISAQTAIACTACSYCTKSCPKQIAIPDYFKLYNEYSRNPNDDWKITPVYGAISQTRGKASDCIGCKLCERNCPQKLPITTYLKDVAKALE